MEAAPRSLSLPARVAAAGGIQSWNSSSGSSAELLDVLSRVCKATTVQQALSELDAIMSLGHNLWAYAYMRVLYTRDMELFYATLLAAPSKLLPVVYTPTVGEACQKFGLLPFTTRGCYVSIAHRGNIAAVLHEYAAAHLERRSDGTYEAEYVVFSDGGRILGLGDLGCWGMGIPIGKLDLYTVCAGAHPRRTVPVILDAGISGSQGNTAGIDIRGHELYTGLKQDRVTHISESGTRVNTAYHCEGGLVEEFMNASVAVFGEGVLLQFEDFNSNDAFPLLDALRGKFLCYNDDIQGTASVTVAGILGAIKLRDPTRSDLIAQLRGQRYLFHGAGSANIGAARLLLDEAGVPPSQVHVTNSRGLIWRSADGKDGNFRNMEQRSVAMEGQPAPPLTELIPIIRQTSPTILVGAVGVVPGCFDRAVVQELCAANEKQRPVIFALSNPRSQAEATADDVYQWSDGRAIFGSGTQFSLSVVQGSKRHPGQVNNVYVFPGVSFAAVQCKATVIPDRLFLVAAEAVANSLNATDLREDRVMPNPDRIREVSLNVATAVVQECQQLGLARERLGDSWQEVQATLRQRMWSPSVGHTASRL